LRLTSNQASHFFESKAFTDFRKHRDAEMKIQVAVVNRLNDVVKSVGILAKMMSKR